MLTHCPVCRTSVGGCVQYIADYNMGYTVGVNKQIYFMECYLLCFLSHFMLTCTYACTHMTMASCIKKTNIVICIVHSKI